MQNEYKIEMKLQEELKPLEEICKKMTEEFAASIDSTKEEDIPVAGQIVDMIKDLCEAKEKVVKACYYKEILKHMEKEEDEKEQEEKDMLRMLKEEYGMEEEDAKRFYRGQPRSRTSGRFMSRGDGRRNNGGRRGYEEMMPMDYRMDIEDYKMYPAERLRDLDREMGRLYFSSSGGGNMGGGGNSSGGSGSSSGGSSGNSSGGSSSRGYEEYQRGYSDGEIRGYSSGYEQGSRDGESRGRSQGSRRDGREGRSGQSRRSYMETKEMNKGNSPQEKQEKMKELEKYMKELAEDVTEMIEDATPEEKSLLKQKLQVLTQKVS